MEEELEEILFGVDMVSPDKLPQSMLQQKPMLTRNLNTPESMMVDDDSDVEDSFRAVATGGGVDESEEARMEY